MASRHSVETSFITSAQRLDHAVKRYWQRRFPGRPGRVLIVQREPAHPKAA